MNTSPTCTCMVDTVSWASRHLSQTQQLIQTLRLHMANRRDTCESGGPVLLPALLSAPPAPLSTRPPVFMATTVRKQFYIFTNPCKRFFFSIRLRQVTKAANVPLRVTLFKIKAEGLYRLTGNHQGLLSSTSGGLVWKK